MMIIYMHYYNLSTGITKFCDRTFIKVVKSLTK